MSLNSKDVWGHFAPMFHLVDAFAVFAITLVGARHAILPTFSAQAALSTIGALHNHAYHSYPFLVFTFYMRTCSLDTVLHGNLKCFPVLLLPAAGVVALPGFNKLCSINCSFIIR